MVEEMEQGERTYEPTPLRLDEARRQGKVVRSHELTGTLVMLGGLGLLALLSPAMLAALVKMTGAMLDGCAASKGDAWAMISMKNCAAPLVWPLAAMAGALVALAVVVNLAQVGLPASTEQVKPDWQRVSVAAGLKRLWSARTLQRATMLLVRLGAVGAITYFTIQAAMPRIAAAGQVSAGVPFVGSPEAASLLWQLALRLGLALVAVGALDYLYQRWQHRRDLRISHRQLRDDLRQMEGDPILRNRRRQMAVNAAARDGRRASGAGAGVTLHTTGAGNV
jgi:flagellar biosynthetic protein FlhB